MKIGILTFHRAHNYGAVLQAYALVTYLREVGYNAEIVDYRPKAIEEAHGTIPYGRMRKMSIKGKVRFILKLLPFIYQRYKRSKIFKRFIDALPTSEHKYTEANTKLSGYDYLICGSDQVWNPNITNGLDPFYTGKIKTNAHFMSYAASAEITPQQKTIEQYRDTLSKFDRVSVRESIFQEQLSKLTVKKIEQVLDPIFLLTPGQWKNFSVNPFVDNKSYVLVYQVKRDDYVLRYAHELANIYNCCVREITAEAEFMPNSERYVSLSPQEFVGAFANAEMVVTTSFHGTAFSIMFDKPFVTMMFGTSGDYRALDLMNTLGIENSTITRQSKVKDFVCKPRKAFNFDKMLRQSKAFLKFNE